MSQASDLARGLMANGLLTAAAVVDGRVLVRDVSRRNRDLIIAARKGEARFAKFASGSGSDASLEREASWYRNLSRLPETSPFLPTLVRYDTHARVLVLEGEEEAVDLWTYHLEGGFPVEVGVQLGRALGALHRATLLPEARPAPELAPWALGLHRPSVASLRDLTPASIELVGILQRHEMVGARLEELGAGWTARSVVHGDLKWSNILAVPSGSSSTPGLKLVDWEHAGEGDPAWDLGSALAAYLSFWLYSIPVRGPRITPEIAALARYPVAVMKPAMGACWSAYIAAAGIPREDLGDLIDRMVGLAGARLVQTAYEATQVTATLGANAALHLQVAANMMERRREAAKALMGISADGGPFAA